MKKECEIVQDLLFCYYDGVASNSSKKLVEDHLQTCENCRQTLKDMEKDKNGQDNQKEIDYLEKINKKMKRKTIITSVSLILLAVLIIGNLYILFSFYQERSYINIYLKDEISFEQIENIRKLLVTQCGENNVKYASKEDALDKVKQKFKDKKELIDNYLVENPFKSSLSVKTREKEKEKVIEMVENLEGVNNITTNTVDNPYLWFIGRILENIW